MAIWPRMLFKRGGGGAGTVTGPASSTDNAIARFDGTGGSTLQNSGWTIDDVDNLAANGSILAKTAGATKVYLHASAAIKLANDRGIEWSSTATAGDNHSLGFDFDSAGVARIDGAAAGDGLGKLKLGGMRIVGYTSSTGAASTTEYPNDKDFGVHKNTTSGVKSIAFNDGGVIVSIAMV